MAEERSGIEMLAELLAEVKLLHQKVDLLDRNLKAVANSAKLADLVTKASGTKFDAFARAGGVQAQAVDAKEIIQKAKDQTQSGMRFKFEPADASKIKQPNLLANKARVPVMEVPKKAIVSGKLVTMNKDQALPLSQVDVKIFNDKDELVKETKTNRAGHWVSHLPAGKYAVSFSGEVDGKKLSPINKIFVVPEGVSEFEVK